MPNFPKVAQTIPSAVFTKSHIFQNSLKSQYTFGLLLLQNVSQELSKITQSGHTARGDLAKWQKMF